MTTTTDTRLKAEREIVRLSNALAEAERERDEAREENAELRDRLRGIEAMSSKGAMRSGGLSYDERLIIIESIANGTRIPRRS